MIKGKIQQLLLMIAGLLIVSSCKPGSRQDRDGVVGIATLRGPSAMSMIQMIDSLHTLDKKTIRWDIKNEPIDRKSVV